MVNAKTSYKTRHQLLSHRAEKVPTARRDKRSFHKNCEVRRAQGLDEKWQQNEKENGHMDTVFLLVMYLLDKCAPLHKPFRVAQNVECNMKSSIAVLCDL